MNYKRVTQALIIGLLVVVLVNIINYNSILEVNDSLVDTIDGQRVKYEKVVQNLVGANKGIENELALQIQYNMDLERDLETFMNEGYPDLWNQADIEILCKTVQSEAGHYNGHDKSQRYVCQVILNRVRSIKFPNTIQDVIYQKVGGIPQFSVAYNGMLDKQEVTEETRRNVYEALLFGVDIPENVLYFYSTNVKSGWILSLPVYDTVQGTIFAYGD